MPNRRDAADGKARLGADQGGIGLAQRLACQGAGLGRIHLIAASRQEQLDVACVQPLEDDGFRDLVDLASGCGCGFGGGAGAVGHLAHIGCDACGGKGGLDPFQTAAHGGSFPLRPKA